MIIVAFIRWIKCLFTGHEPATVQIVVTKATFNTPPHPTFGLKEFEISSPLYYCRKCGRLSYGP